MTKVLIYTGITYTDAESEIIDLSSSERTECPSWKKYPYNIRGAVGGFLGTNPIFCGGARYSLSSFDNSIEYSNECHIIRPKKAEKFTNMLSKRYGAASVIINEKILWVSGGNDGINTLSSTEFIESESTAGPELPEALEGHKMIDITNDFTLLIGGSLTKSINPVKCVSKLLHSLTQGSYPCEDKKRACLEECCQTMFMASGGSMLTENPCVRCECLTGVGQAKTYYYNHDRTQNSPQVGNHFRFIFNEPSKTPLHAFLKSV